MSSELEQIRDQQRETWDKFSSGWKKWDHHVLSWLAPFGDALIAGAQLREDSIVLDVAAGTGEPGLTIATRVPKGKVVVTDLAERMLAVARENAARRGIKNFETQQCDAGALPFTDNTFDAVTCRFGFMFFPDVKACVKELVRVAKPHARVCAAVWSTPDKNPWATTVMGTIAKNVDMPPPPPGAPGLFRCAAPGYMSAAFRDAGLKNISEQEIASELKFDSPEEYWSFMTEIAAPVVAGLGKADEAARQTIKSTVLDLAKQSSSGGRPRFHSVAVTIYGEK